MMHTRIAKAAWDEIPPERIKDVLWANDSSVTHEEYSNGRFRIVEYSTDGFMGDAVSALPDNV